MISAVFDCVVYVQAAISSDGPAGSCLTFAEKGDVKLFASSATLAECRETLSQPKLRFRFPHLTDERVEYFLQRVGQIAEFVHDVPAVFRLTRDPDDAMYVDLAVATHASFLVRRDKDLLSLMTDEAFCKLHPELAVIPPAAFLAHVRKEIANQLGKG